MAGSGEGEMRLVEMQCRAPAGRHIIAATERSGGMPHAPFGIGISPSRPPPAMGCSQSKSLTNEEVYALAAYILAQNKIIGEDDVMDAPTLPQVKMPNRDGFVRFERGK